MFFRIADLTEELRSLEKQGSTDGNPQTLFLISEKAELLNELYTQTAGVQNSATEKKTAANKCKKLEQELR